MIVIRIVVVMAIGVLSFWAGYALAGILGLGAEADRQMEAMRRRHIGDVTDWLDRKREEMR